MVRRDDDLRALPRRAVDDAMPTIPRDFRVEPVERLVEQQQVARQHERARKERGRNCPYESSRGPRSQSVLRFELHATCSLLACSSARGRRD